MKHYAASYTSHKPIDSFTHLLSNLFPWKPDCGISSEEMKKIKNCAVTLSLANASKKFVVLFDILQFNVSSSLY